MKESLARFSVPATVFVTGAGILVTEIAATRILAPYFGTTTYAVSSVIGVILAALSCGYYFGGRFADRHPDQRWFYGIIAAGGVALLSMRAAMGALLPSYGYALSYVSGPLAWSMLLFFLPCLLLGALSPFAVVLQKKRFPEKGPGTVSGEVFFWSTVGSIVGSLLAGFVLIPRFSLSDIIAAVAAILLAIGLVGLRTAWRGIGRSSAAIAILAISILYISGGGVDRKAVYAKDGAYQRIAVYDGQEDGRAARFLVLDGLVSGGMFLGSDEHVYPYTEYYAAHRLFTPIVRDALIIGGGAFTVPKSLLHDFPEARVDVVEIDPDLEKVGRLLFDVPEDPRLAIHIDDGRRFLHADVRDYDIIFSDVNRTFFIPPHLATTEYFEAGKRRLREGGVFIANVIGNAEETGPSFLSSEMRTFMDIFPESYFFSAQPAEFGPVRNIMFVGVKDGKRRDFVAEARAHPDPFIRGLPDRLMDSGRIDRAAHAAFTDDFAPVESMAARGFFGPGRRPTRFSAP